VEGKWPEREKVKLKASAHGERGLGAGKNPHWKNPSTRGGKKGLLFKPTKKENPVCGKKNRVTAHEKGIHVESTWVREEGKEKKKKEKQSSIYMRNR